MFPLMKLLELEISGLPCASLKTTRAGDRKLLPGIPLPGVQEHSNLSSNRSDRRTYRRVGTPPLQTSQSSHSGSAPATGPASAACGADPEGSLPRGLCQVTERHPKRFARLVCESGSPEIGLFPCSLNGPFPHVHRV